MFCSQSFVGGNGLALKATSQRLQPALSKLSRPSKAVSVNMMESGFVPDMGRRNLMNALLLGSVGFFTTYTYAYLRF